MKQLYLLRHAKSAWDDPALSDYDRPLAPRGKRATKRLARHIREHGYQFDLVLCSAARRAADTWRRIAATAGIDSPLELERALYLAGEDAFMTRLRQLDDDLESVLLVAHNPDIEGFATTLCADGERDALALISAKFPTGGFASIRINCEHWAALEPGCGYLESFVVPRQLGDD